MPVPRMHPLISRLGLIASLGLATVLSAFASPAAADRASEDAVKAGLIYNFAKYTEWPDELASGRFTICTLETDALSGRLELLQGRRVGEQEVGVRAAGTRPADLGNCQVVFLSGSDEEKVLAALRSLASQPVLTVSDLPKFAEKGGMIGLKTVDGRMRFEINQSQAQRAGLKMSSQMLKLADRVWH